MIVLAYLLVAALVSVVAHWLLGADSHDAALAGVAWPLEGLLIMMLGLALVAASPVLLVLHVRRRAADRRSV